MDTRKDLVVLHADSIKVMGPKVDGGFSVTISVGEYEANKVADLLNLPREVLLKVTVEIDPQG